MQSKANATASKKDKLIEKNIYEILNEMLLDKL